NIVRIVGNAHGFQDKTAGSFMEVSFERALSVQDYLVDECGIDPKILRIELAGEREPMADAGSDAAQHRRVQIYMTDKTIDQIHPDPNGTGREQD
ncbi:MAG: hypothetical protein K8E66_12765, partial [Phycisphaerales bacterium]|nr:hypothetical protein [Phycisphaerales bacterium]